MSSHHLSLFLKKKGNLCVCIVVLLFTFKANSQFVPISEGFEGRFPLPGWSWSTTSQQGEAWQKYPNEHHTGSFCAAQFPSDESSDVWLFTAPLNLQGGRYYGLDFFGKLQPGTRLRIYLNTLPYPDVAYRAKTIRTIDGAPTTDWLPYKDSILVETTGTYYIAFNNRSISGNFGYAFIDDLNFGVLNIPACTSIAAGNISSSATTICAGSPITLTNTNATTSNIEGIRYAWQKSSDGTNWNNITNTGIYQASIQLTQTASTWYRLTDTCLSSGATSISNQVKVDINSYLNCYCTHNSMNCNNLAIGNVKIPGTAFDIPTACENGGYTFFANVTPPNVSRGQNLTLITSVYNPNGAYNLLIWIDFDHSGTFDSQEFLWTYYPGSGNTTQYFIPPSALTGLTRMRLKIRPSSSISSPLTTEACSSINSAGEVEDYTINIVDPPNCNGAVTAGTVTSSVSQICPNANFTLSVTNTTVGQGQIRYSWQKSTDGVNWSNINNTPYLLNSITVNENSTTQYRLTDTCLATGQSAVSNSITVTANNLFTCYCTPPASNCSIYSIEEVKFGTIQNATTTCGTGYNNYTTLSTTVNNGTMVPISLKFKTTANAKYVYGFIDFNRDGVYSSSEIVLNTVLTNGDAYNGFIKIPFNVEGGETGMRISVNSVTGVNGCGTANGNGEVEDYKIFVNAVNPENGKFSYYVKQNASGTREGTSWANAFATIDSAFLFAGPNDTIRVAKGIYKPGNAATSLYNLKDSMILMGGYPDTGNPTDANKHAGLYPTILSGEIGTAAKTDNIKILVQANNVKGFLVDGFIIENGYDGTTSTRGPVNIVNSTGTLKNTVIRNNYNQTNGSAYNIQASTVNLINNIIENNVTDGGLAALNFTARSNVTMTNCVLAKNRGNRFLNMQNSTVKLLNSTIVKNYGQAYLYDTSKLIVQNSIFYKNAVNFWTDVDELTTDSYSSIDLKNTITEVYNYNSDLFNGQNPKFRDTLAIAGQDNAYFTNDDGLNLISPCSPAINTGNNNFATGLTTDISGNSRIKNGVIDLGAYEVQETLSRQPEVLYVNKNATGANNGLSWQDAFTDLQKAFNACSDSIKVAKGTYPVSSTDITAYFQLDNNRVVIGGFPNTGDPGNGSYDPIVNATFIDGSVNATDKCYMLVLSRNNNSNTKLIGFQLINSQRPLLSNIQRAALKIAQRSNAYFENIKLDAASNRQYSLVLISQASNPVFSKSVFFNFIPPPPVSNPTEDWGKRTVDVQSKSAPIFTKCYIGIDTLNTQQGTKGVNIAITDASPVIDSCVFNRGTDNAIFTNNAGNSKPVIRNSLFMRTAGRSMTFRGSSPLITNCIFNDSIVVSDNYGGTIGNYDNSSPLFIKCQFNGSGSRSSGGIGFNENSTPTFKQCIFNAPSAYSNGAGFFNSNSDLILSNCIATGIYNTPSLASNFIYNTLNSSASIINTTILATTNNQTPIIICRQSSTVKFYNSIFWRYGLGGSVTDAQNDISTDNNSDPAVCDIRNSLLYKQTNTPMLNTRTGVNPKLVDLTFAVGKDSTINTGDDGLMPCNCSPAINAGDNALIADGNDILGAGRIYGGTVDIGAYELQANAGENKTLFVKQSAAAGGDGLSWATAYNNLQQAILNKCGDTIRVAKGIYKPATTSRDSTFDIYSGQAILGGYPDTGNPTEADRNTSANPTILSGDIGVPNDSTDNSYSVVMVHCPDTTVILDGLIIERGNANVNDIHNSGGGIHARGDKLLFIRNCIIRNNYGFFGGGLITTLSNTYISKTVFADNNSSYGGGAHLRNFANITNSVFANNKGSGVNVWSGGGFTFDNTIFYKNQGETGGGILINDNSGVVVRNSAFVRNVSTFNKPGSAILVTATTSGLNTYVFNTIFKENSGSFLNNDFNWILGSAMQKEIPFENFGYNIMNSGGSQTGMGATNIEGTVFMKDVDNGAGPDNVWMTKDDGLQSVPCAININRGNNQRAILPVDILDSIRIKDRVVDVGPYETGYLSVSISASDTLVCPATQVTFTANGVNAGTAPVYQWTLNGVNVGSNSSTFSSNTLNDNDKIRVSVTNVGCIQNATVQSNIITMHVGSSFVPVAKITASDTTICSGSPIAFNASVTQVNSNTTYQWQVNNINAGTNSPQFIASNLANGDIVKAIITVNGACVSPQTATSNSILIHVNPRLAPSVSITASANSICAGTLVSYTATPVNGGTSPSYQWKINGINKGSNSALFSPVNIANNDQVSVIMTSSAGCLAASTATSNIITQQVNVAAQPTITINSTPLTCPGSPTTFTANVTNAGSGASYKWLLNGNDIGNPTNTFTSASLLEGDILETVLLTNSSCINSASVKSLPLTIHYSSGLAPSVSITTPNASNICPGVSTSFTATAINGGSNPGYQWMVNNINTGETGVVFTTNTLSNKDEVKVVLTSSAFCALKPQVTSNVIIIKGPTAPTVTPTGSLSFCEGGSVLLTSSVATGNQWYKNGSPINAATGITYTASSSGNYTVATITGSCSSQSSTPLSVIAIAPPVPTIVLSGNQLTTSSGMQSYQWYFNNTVISGATSNTITPGTQGIYKVEVVNSNGCKGTSVDYNFVLTAVSTVTVNGLDIICFPNPARTELNIRLSATPVSKPLTQLIDQSGRVILETRLTNILTTLNVSGLASGVYLLNIVGKERATLKVVITH